MKLTGQENYAINRIIGVADGIKRLADYNSVGLELIGVGANKEFNSSISLMAEEIIHLIEDLETSLKNR